MATAQAQLVALPSPNRGHPWFIQQFIECLLHVKFCLGISNTAMNKTGGELALRELTF